MSTKKPDQLLPPAKPSHRAAIAAKVVAQYENRKGTGSAITELLADLRHLCDRESLDFGRLDEGAYRKYFEEVAEEKRR